jgi:hypothetical protein
MELIGSSETSVLDYFTLRKTLEDERIQFNRVDNLQSRTARYLCLNLT